jgi:hypothetical protein
MNRFDSGRDLRGADSFSILLAQGKEISRIQLFTRLILQRSGENTFFLSPPKQISVIF